MMSPTNLNPDMKTWDILGLGCVAVDDLLYVPSFPVADTKVQVIKQERQCGGITGTALVTAARLGARCAFAGLLGTDELSRVIEENFLREGVEVSLAPRSNDAPAPHSVIIVGVETGSRNIFYRVEGRVGADELLPDESVIRSARVLFLDQYGMAGNLRAASIARAEGIPIVADFEEATDPRFPELLELVNHLILPYEFAKKLTAAKSAEAAVVGLWHNKRHAVVITDGSAGSWFLGQDRVVRHQPAFEVNAVDTTGCGDVFHGAYAAALAEGATLRECVRIATATAGLKTMKHGGQQGIPTRDQVEGFLRTKPNIIL
jgi:sugar/nucleoside kinase (ribokinase family)